MSKPDCRTDQAAETTPGETPQATIDAFHRGRFHLVQPRGKGHRAGLDAMLLASLVSDDAHGKLADFGAGAGAAGIAVASRSPELDVVLVERSVEMSGFARRSIDLEHNAEFADRVSLLVADVTLKGRQRAAAGLTDSCFDHVIMNPPFNSSADRTTPDALRAEAHAMPEHMFEHWIRSACAVCKPGGQLSLIARPQSLRDILQACDGRFGGLQVTPVHPRPGEDAIRILFTGIKGNRARLSFRTPLFVHDSDGRAFSARMNDLNNGRAFVHR
ncbi:tRNA1(Val) (adenine(37)-N6)-methyltransferase [Hoeflea sp. TYP-13]|uniref:tRNA1(Val) (adenine(37)-N6)-methyltransferase n=1 Tax=Hoeflea sp. TYP-13 TaxID=3230023 RepID=UPI0034C5C57E